MIPKLKVQLEQYFQLLEIEKQMFPIAFASDEKVMSAFLYKKDLDKQIINESIEQKDLTMYALNSFVNGTLIYWNESIGVSIELFWQQVHLKNLPYIRKDPLAFALEKGRFRNVHQGRDARYNWKDLIDAKLLLSRYSEEEIARLDQIIKNDEANRVSLLKKCIKNNKVPGSQYLRFGDSVAYLTDGKLLDDGAYKGTLLESHFTEPEIRILDAIWK